MPPVISQVGVAGVLENEGFGPAIGVEVGCDSRSRPPALTASGFSSGHAAVMAERADALLAGAARDRMRQVDGVRVIRAGPARRWPSGRTGSATGTPNAAGEVAGAGVGRDHQADRRTHALVSPIAERLVGQADHRAGDRPAPTISAGRVALAGPADDQDRGPGVVDQPPGEGRRSAPSASSWPARTRRRCSGRRPGRSAGRPRRSQARSAAASSSGVVKSSVRAESTGQPRWPGESPGNSRRPGRAEPAAGVVAGRRPAGRSAGGRGRPGRSRPAGGSPATPGEQGRAERVGQQHGQLGRSARSSRGRRPGPAPRVA